MCFEVLVHTLPASSMKKPSTPSSSSAKVPRPQAAGVRELECPCTRTRTRGGLRTVCTSRKSSKKNIDQPHHTILRMELPSQDQEDHVRYHRELECQRSARHSAGAKQRRERHFHKLFRHLRKTQVPVNQTLLDCGF